MELNDSLFATDPVGCIALGLLVFWVLRTIWKHERKPRFPDIEKQDKWA